MVNSSDLRQTAPLPVPCPDSGRIWTYSLNAEAQMDKNRVIILSGFKSEVKILTYK